jgi:orotate phosphoribosyltransferase
MGAISSCPSCGPVQDVPPGPSPADLLNVLAGDDIRAFQTDDQRRAELLADVVSAAWGTHGEFIDADQFLTRPTVLRRLASLLAGRVEGDIDRLVAREPNALVLGAALALETGLPLVVARAVSPSAPLSGPAAGPKSPPGPELRCFGELHPGERVFVVEAVTGTGTSAEQAVGAARRRGAAVIRVLTAVDRGAGAADRFGGLGIAFDALFNDVELRAVALHGRDPA